MRILILGSGGREHAFVWKISQSPLCEELVIAPGNGGTKRLGLNLPVNVTDFHAIADIVMEHKIDMIVVGPEAPLVEGIYDYFKNREGFRHVKVIGPSKQAALLEGSKSFAKGFMSRNGIPTAAYREFSIDNIDEGLAYLESQQPPIVLKADGLAAGKGVLICDTIEEAKKEFEVMIRDGKFGKASAKVVVEQFLSGREFSVFVLTDGEHYKILPIARDYKRVGEGDTGLNTGGMGAVSPVDFVTEEMMQKVVDKIVEPSINGLSKEELDFKGFLYCGLIDVDGEPYVIEYNSRMGDPETQVVLPRLKSDLAKLFKHVAEGSLDQTDIEILPEHAATVVLASGGYPEAYEKGKHISGLEDKPDVIVFHAGTKVEDGSLITSGGRVLAITGIGPTTKTALAKAYYAADEVLFDGKYMRRDIGS